MPKKPKRRSDGTFENEPEAADPGADTIDESGYYYDDSHGYQTYKSDQPDHQFEDDDT